MLLLGSPEKHFVIVTNLAIVLFDICKLFKEAWMLAL